jgi:hypothetical protein
MKFTIDTGNQTVKVYNNLTFDELSFIKSLISTGYNNVDTWTILIEEEKQTVTNDYYKSN